MIEKKKSSKPWPGARLSRQFIAELKLHSRPAYRIAQEAGVNPATLSKLIRGIEPAAPEDWRIIAVGRVLGISPADCFEGVSDAGS